MLPALAAPRTAPPATGRSDATASRTLWLWRGYGPALTPRGLAPLHVAGAAPVVDTPYGRGTRIERGTTNFVTNPSFEVDLAGWSALGSPVITRETAGGAAFGDAYARVAVGAVGDGLRFTGTGNATEGETYTASLHLRAATPSDIGKQVQVLLDSGGGAYEIVTSDFQLTAGWERLALGLEWAESGHVGWGLAVRDAIGQGTFAFEVDAAQYEPESVSTSFADGSLGDGHSWQGVAHASPSTRDSAFLSSIVESQLLDTAELTAICELVFPLPSGDHPVLQLRGDYERVSVLVSNDSWRLLSEHGASPSTAEVTHAVVGAAVIRVCASWGRGTLQLRVGDVASRSARPHAKSSGTTRLFLGASPEDADRLGGVLQAVTIEAR